MPQSPEEDKPDWLEWTCRIATLASLAGVLVVPVVLSQDNLPQHQPIVTPNTSGPSK